MPVPRFSPETLRQIENVARAYGIEPAALKAVAAVESGGRAFARIDGRAEPLIRFEGHYFDRLLTGDKRAAARRAGLASPRAGAVKNPRDQAGRWRLLDKACAIDRAAALQSVSWGIGQVMGAHWQALGYASVEAMVREARSGVEGQLALMVRFMRVNRLLPLLQTRDWAGFARRYNGPAWRRNRYDARLAAAHARYRGHDAPAGSPAVLRSGDNGPGVADLQRKLTAAGFPLAADGAFGPRTEAALRAFQRRAGLAVDGVYGPRSAGALHRALARPGWPRALWRNIQGLLAVLPWIGRRLG
ncbi:MULTISPECIES: N-acetylmuramidase domain-containing protein [unclassified Roseitalea]|uniref:N-acetylmuramidase domain-containing protein n=1 Tax=unclassified Roseitalea TaxID=2639107 RepID=UPI00273DB733|nr:MULTISPECIES: N-acetylmuramidase domain-containing protein [unclassified Roseitalea]